MRCPRSPAPRPALHRNGIGRETGTEYNPSPAPLQTARRRRLQAKSSGPGPAGSPAISFDNRGVRFMLLAENRRGTGPAVAISPNRIVVLLLAVVTASIISGGASGRTVGAPGRSQPLAFNPGPTAPDPSFGAAPPSWNYGGTPPPWGGRNRPAGNPPRAVHP